MREQSLLSAMSAGVPFVSQLVITSRPGYIYDLHNVIEEEVLKVFSSKSFWIIILDSLPGFFFFKEEVDELLNMSLHAPK